MFKFRFNPLQPGNINPRAENDGYFGWTDRYGLRAADLGEQSKLKTHQKPYFIANY